MMAKSFGGLWEKIISFENLLAAYREARKGKAEKPEVLFFSDKLESNLIRIQGELALGKWTPAPYREFLAVHSMKRRFVQAPAFSDRVVHHALIRITQPLLERGWVYDSYACRVGKGTHSSVARLKKFLFQASRRWPKPYVLQIDVSKFFPSIHHETLIEMIDGVFRENEIRSLFREIITARNPSGIGLPIGALTSQTLANHYLSEADHFVKECLGVKFYVRYMDDMIILGEKQKLRAMLADIEWMLQARLKLKINPKTKIFPSACGVDFAGYRTWETHILPRKRNMKAARRRFKAISLRYARGEVDLDYALARLASFIGYTKHCDSTKSADSALKHLILRRSKNENY